LKKQLWHDVVAKIRNKLSRWEGKQLTFVGRVCLIKSVLSSLPLFYLSFFKAPK